MDTDDGIGQMDLEYVQDRLVDFNLSIVQSDLDDALCKLNALSTSYRIKNGDLIDDLIAFVSNCKKSQITLGLIDDYETQVLCKSKTKSNSSVVRNNTSLNISHNRQILKDIPIPLDSLTGNNTSIFDDNFNDAFGDYNLQNSEEVKLSIIPKKSVIKFKYTGASYVQNTRDGENREYFPLTELPKHKILSDRKSSSYLYGHGSMAFDIHEIIPFNMIEDKGFVVTEDEELHTELFGYVFPLDGNYLTFDNIALFTSSKSYHLDFGKVERISIFPGMSLKAKCFHQNGLCQIQQILEPNSIDITPLDHTTEFANLRLYIAYGPFYIDKAMSEFKQMMALARADRANAIVLIGPFVPTQSQLDGPFDELFDELVQEIAVYSIRSNMRIYLVPNSQLDLISMPYFPTPPIEVKVKEKLPENITLLPDPAIFELEGVRIAVSSSEIIMHLCKKEIYKSTNMENEDRMQRLVSQLFRSRSLYPLYPNDANLPFSLPNSRAKLQLDKKPHILILPSMLQPVVKVVEDSLYINPGRFMRGKSVSTFAFVDIDLQSALASNSPGTGASISQFSEITIQTL